MNSQHRLIAVVLLIVAGFVGWNQYLQLLRENSDKYFVMEQKTRNYELKTARLRAENNRLELRVKELKLIVEKTR